MSEQIITKRCFTCNQIKPFSDFTKDCTHKDGFSTQCKLCNRKYRQSTKGKAMLRKGFKKYKTTEKGKTTIRNFAKRYYKQNTEKHIAKGRVRYAIIKGKILPATFFFCYGCLRKKAEMYHHYAGYKPIHWFDIIPLCRNCHTVIHKLYL